MKIALILGTRPEAIKMAPVYFELEKRGEQADIISTGQHRQMLDQALQIFDIKPRFDLHVMTDRQSLSLLTQKIIAGLQELFDREKYDIVLVQGDTTTSFCGALVSFYNKIPVGHIEAGLRTNSIYDPFPEEINRRLTSKIASMNFAATSVSADNLLKEGITEKSIFITGNTVIDSIKWIQKNKQFDTNAIRQKYNVASGKYILMTLHRRENYGRPMEEIFRAVKKFLQSNSEYKLIFPVHMSPDVREYVYKNMEGVKNVILTQPVDYIDFIALMSESSFILTDSGGIQEEAPTFGIPTVVLRNTTERTEALSAGTAILAGTYENEILACLELMTTEKCLEMVKIKNPYGDGFASQKIVDILQSY